MSIFHYRIVRQDIPHGSRYAWIDHAASESSSGTLKLPADSRSCVLAAENEARLLETADALAALGIEFTIVREDEGGFAGQAMAIGVNPWEPREKVRPALAKLVPLK